MDRLVCNELVDLTYEVFDRLKLVDVLLYIAHIDYNKSIQALSRQTPFLYDDIEERIAFVESHLRRTLADYL